MIGDRLAMVAFPWLIYQATDSALSTGIILALYTLPYVLFGTVAGIAIDRFNKRTVMVVADLTRAGLALLLPAVAARWLPGVYVISFLMASVAVFFDPCKLTLLPDIVARHQLMRANSLLATGEYLTEIIGYSLAGFLLALVSTATAFRLDAVTFLVSAAALSLLRYHRPAREGVARARQSIAHELREGLSFLRHHRGLLTNTIMVTFAVAGVGLGYPLTFFLAVRVFDAGTKGFGLLEAAVGLGYFIGSIALATAATRVRKGLAMTVGLCVMGASFVLVAATGAVWQAFIPLTIVGVANAAALIAIDTYFQEVVPEHLRGRVWGVRFTITQGTYAIAVIVAGALASTYSVRALFIVAGILVALPAIAGLFVRDIRDA